MASISPRSHACALILARRDILAGRKTQGQTAEPRRSLPTQRNNRRTATTALGVPLDSVSVKLDGVLDLRGFFAVGEERARPGFTRAQGTVTLKSSASREQLAKLKEVADAHCPVLDILRAPVPVELKLAAAPVAVAA
jgi:OsmC-like protein